MQEILTSRAIQTLVEQGKTKEALEAIDYTIQTYRSSPDSNSIDPATGGMFYQEEINGLLAEKAWCHYRREEYDLCRAAINDAPGNLRAKECLAQLAAYVDKDDDLLARIASELPENMGVANAFVIRARDKDSEIEYEAVIRSVVRARGLPDIAATNLIHNAGRFFEAKSRGTGDDLMALGLLELAFIRYGEGNKNLHHRAAVLFWQSKIVEELSGPEAACVPARGSLFLWERQLQLDPTNPAFQEKFENAKVRLAELGG